MGVEVMCREVGWREDEETPMLKKFCGTNADVNGKR